MVLDETLLNSAENTLFLVHPGAGFWPRDHHCGRLEDFTRGLRSESGPRRRNLGSRPRQFGRRLEVVLLKNHLIHRCFEKKEYLRPGAVDD